MVWGKKTPKKPTVALAAMQLSSSREERCTRLTQREQSVWSQMLPQNVCNSIHQWLVAPMPILMAIPRGCRVSLKYLQAVWGQIHVHIHTDTHTLLPPHTHAHASTRTRKQTALSAQLGFCRIQGREADFCRRVWESRTLGCYKTSSYLQASFALGKAL